MATTTLPVHAPKTELAASPAAGQSLKGAHAGLERQLATALDGKEFMGSKIIGKDIAFIAKEDTDKIVNLSIPLKNEQTGKVGRVSIIAYRPVGKDLTQGFAESSPNVVFKVQVMLPSPAFMAFYDVHKDATIKNTAGTYDKDNKNIADTPERISEVRNLLVAVDEAGAKFATR